MDSSPFDESAAIENLKNIEKRAAADRESMRVSLLEKVKSILVQELSAKKCDVWLIGSLIQEGHFSKRSDVEIVIKNYEGDRFDLWTFLERKIGHQIMIFSFENCHFQDFVHNYGKKIL